MTHVDKRVLASEEETVKFMSEANNWIHDPITKSRFNSYLGVAKVAVAEYLANKEGKTLYPE